MTVPASAQARGGRTKRQRSRAALLDAARQVFADRGWQGTRMEDVAAAAGVSPATAYKHFASKHALIATVYAPLLDPLRQQARADVAQARPAVDSLRRYLQELVRLVGEQRQLTLPLLEAAIDAMLRWGWPPVRDDDPRRIASVPEPLVWLIAAGQHRGELAGEPPAEEAAPFLINAVTIHLFTRRDADPDKTGKLALAFLLRTLAPPGTPRDCP